MPKSAQGPITIYAPRRVAVSFPLSSRRSGLKAQLKVLLSVLLVSGFLGGLYPLIGEVWGVLAQGGSAVTLDRVLDENFNLSLSGYLEGSQLKSTASAGAPLTVASSGLVTNLNSDLLDGQHGSYYLNWSNATSKPTILSSLDGVTNNLGNIDLVAGANITITPNDLAKTVTIAAAGATPSGWIDDGTVVRLQTATDRVGIGTSVPEGLLHIYAASAGTVTADTSADDLIVEGSSNPGISIIGPDDQFTSLYFGIASNPSISRIYNDGDNNSFNFATSNALMAFDTASPGVFIFNDAQGDVDFRIKSNLSQYAFWMDATTGNVIIDPSSAGVGPDGTLHVHTATAGSVSASANAMDLVVENGGNVGISLISPASAMGSIEFTNPSVSAAGAIRYSHVSNAMLFTVNDGISALDLEAGGAVFNDGALNYDFRVEGQTDPNLIFGDASTSRVGIGAASPNAKLDINGAITPDGSELITNGTFTGSASGWTLGNCASYGSNQVTSTYTACSEPWLYQAVSFTAGKTYFVTFTISGATSRVYFFFENQTYYSPGVGNGTHTFSFTAEVTGSDNIWFYDFLFLAGGTWTIDDVSVREVSSFAPALAVAGYDGSRWLTVGGVADNLAIGGRALASTTTGIFNLALGHSALYSNVVNDANVAVGNFSLYSNTASFNTALGNYTLYQNTTGSNQLALGYQALYSNTTGTSNVAAGYNALQDNTTGSSNVAVGTSALANNTTGSSNVAVGLNALTAATTANNNTALGFSAGSALTGANNVLVGYGAGNNLTTGTNNIVLGYDIDAPAVDSTNTLNIGSLIFGTGIDGTGTTISSGSIGIGTKTPGKRLEVATSSEGAVLRLYDGTETCDLDPDASAVTETCSSDARLKTNIGEASPALGYLTGLPIKEFDVISSGEHSIGVIAQELLALGEYAELVSQGSDGYYRVSSISPWKVIKGIQELNQKIEDLKTLIDSDGDLAEESPGGYPSKIEAESVAAGEGIFEKIIATVSAVFENLAASVAEFGKLKIGSSAAPAGITIYDRTTGEPYCVSISEGEWLKEPGECE